MSQKEVVRSSVELPSARSLQPISAASKGGLRMTAGASTWAPPITVCLAFAFGVTVLLILMAKPAQGASVLAKQADAFVDSMGVNVHLHYTDTVYVTQWAGIKDKLATLGMRHIRDHAYHTTNNSTEGTNATFYDHIRQLNASGIKANFIFDPRWKGLEAPVTNQDMADVAKKAGGALESIEGPNEPDLNLGGNWARTTRSYQQSLYSASKNNPSTSSLPVLAPAIGHGWNTTTAKKLGDLSQYSDRGNMHSYPGGQMPSESRLDAYIIPNAKIVVPSKPIMSTETGYHNALQTTSGHKPVSEKAASKYMPRLYFEYFNRDVIRSYPYEFVDEGVSSTNIESSFGLLRNDLSEKPAYNALKNTIALLKDPGTTFTTKTLDYSLSGNTTNIHTTLLQKRDGRFYLALWKEVSSYDVDARTDITVSSTPVTLVLNTPISGANVYKPSTNISPIGQYGAVNKLDLSVPDEVLIVELMPATEAP